MGGSYHIASVSWGKDSLCMLIELICRNEPLHEVIFYDTGMEFKAIYDTRDKMIQILKERRIKYTEIEPDYNFEWKMFDKPVNGTKNGFHYGYSWCGGRCRWGTTDKLKSLDKYAEERNAKMYIGIAADETERLEKDRKPYKQFPLADFGIIEKNALEICYTAGFYWMEKGHRLYDLLDRVSCWCCANKNLKELKNIFLYLPEYWERLKKMQRRTDRPMKGTGKSVFELEERFIREIGEK